MPVCWSGVMFGARMLPNGVSIGRPPAKSLTASRQCMTRGAIADDRQVAAALDLLEILFVDIARDGAAGRQRQSAHRKCASALS